MATHTDQELIWELQLNLGYMNKQNTFSICLEFDEIVKQREVIIELTSAVLLPPTPPCFLAVKGLPFLS